jgi:DNA modification methylase
MTPVHADDWLTLYQGDCRAVMAEIATESVNCVITSPPYWGLRDYGLPPTVWDDYSDPTQHTHEWEPLPVRRETRGPEASTLEGAFNKAARFDRSRGALCGCGAWLGCLGLEPDPWMFVNHVVEVFREVRRVLRKDGVVWLNIGDSYADRANKRSDGESFREDRADVVPAKKNSIGGPWKLKAKDRIGIPQHVVQALQADGWWWRDEVVWHKPNPMPSSVEDRTTPAHEMVYLLTKSGDSVFWTHHDGRRAERRPAPDYRWLDRADKTETPAEPADWREARLPDGERRWRRLNLWAGHDYFYDAPAIREIGTTTDPRLLEFGPRPDVGYPDVSQNRRRKGATPDKQSATGDAAVGSGSRTYPGFNERWDARVRAVDSIQMDPAARPPGSDPHAGLHRAGTLRLAPQRNKRSVWTVATQPYADAHFATFPEKLIEPMIVAGCPAGGLVLDPFGGSGTTGIVAEALGRRAVLIDLSPEYLEQALKRIAGARYDRDGHTVDIAIAPPDDGLWAGVP